MRFNPKHTCIDFLSGNIPDDIHIPKKNWEYARKHQTRNDIKEVFAKHSERLGAKVQYVTDSFARAFQVAQSKIYEVLKTEPLGEMDGTMIFSCGDGVTKTVFYSIQQDKLDAFDVMYMSFTRGHGMTAVDAIIQYDKVEGLAEMNMSTCVSDLYHEMHKLTHTDIIVNFILLLGFMKYCDIETKVLKPKEKHREFGIKYYNEEKRNIEILDSRWFTDIIREEGFKVRGFFRLQPYGPGNSMRRWQYIKPFMKEGYRSKAKKHE